MTKKTRDAERERMPTNQTYAALALAFVERHGPDLRYVAAWSKWLKWTGGRWEQEETNAAFDLARKSVRETIKNAG